MAAPAVAPKPGRVFYGWYIVAANVAIAFIGGFHFNSGSVYFLPMAESLNLTRTQLSFVFAAARLEGGIEGPAIGWLIDRIGTRKLIMIGVAMCAVGYFVLGTMVDSFPKLLLVYLIFISTGASLGFFAPLMAAANNWFVRKRTVALSFTNMASRGSGFILTPFLSYMVLSIGWQSAAMVAAVAMVAVVFSVVWVHRPSPERMGLLPDGDPPTPPGAVTDGRAGHGAVHRRPVGADFTAKEALRTRAFWMLTAALSLRFLIGGGLAVHLIAILVWKGLDRQQAANMVGLMALIGIPAVLFFGWAGDRFTKKIVIAVGVTSGALGAWTLGLSTEIWHLYIYIVLNGIAEASFPVGVSLSGEYFGRKSFATVRGISQLFTSIAVFTGTVFAGWVWDQTGSYKGAIVPMAALTSLAIPLFLLLRPPPPPRRSEGTPAAAVAS